MGTGCLALAYGAKEGGSVLFIGGTVLLGLWNVLSVDRLIRSLNYIPSMSVASNGSVTVSSGGGAKEAPTNRQIYRPPPPSGTSTIGRYAS